MGNFCGCSCNQNNQENEGEAKTVNNKIINKHNFSFFIVNEK